MNILEDIPQDSGRGNLGELLFAYLFYIVNN